MNFSIFIMSPDLISVLLYNHFSTHEKFDRRTKSCYFWLLTSYCYEKSNFIHLETLLAASVIAERPDQSHRSMRVLYYWNLHR